MNATTVAVDLAKSVFQLAVADASWSYCEPVGIPVNVTDIPVNVTEGRCCAF